MSDNQNVSFDPSATARETKQIASSNPKHNEQLFRLLVSSVKDYAIFVLDPEGHVMTWNEGAERIKGYSADDIIGKHFSTFYTEDAKVIRHPDNELKLAREKGRYEEEGWRVRKDGSLFWANVVITALRDESGELLGFSKVTRDLTERKQAEELREENTRLIAESNEELQRLAYVVSHELQAPIYTISRYCNLLSARYKDRLGEDANEFIAKVVNSSSLIARMIDDIWIYARIAKPNLEKEMVYTVRALEDALSELRPELHGDEVTHGELPSVLANKQQLVYLFKELVQNAVKYRNALPPKIHIDAARERNGYTFSVTDNGMGIDSVYTNDIFKLFHRLNCGPDNSGTGMGLAICKKIVQQHGGRIWCEPQVKGTRFCFWLPER